MHSQIHAIAFTMCSVSLESGNKYIVDITAIYGKRKHFAITDITIKYC